MTTTKLTRKEETTLKEMLRLAKIGDAVDAINNAIAEFPEIEASDLIETITAMAERKRS